MSPELQNTQSISEVRELTEQDDRQGFNSVIEMIDATIYDANAEQRFEFEVTENGERFDTAHIYRPLADERYLAYLKSLKVRGDDTEAESNEIEAVTTLWDDLIKEVENFDSEGAEDWKSLIDFTEKRESMTNYLSVAIVEPETKSGGKRRASAMTTEIVTTEAFFNFPQTSQQKHVLQKKTDERRKKYERIQAKRFRQELTKGLRRAPKVEYVPQDEAIGKLYDEMFISAEGFRENNIPLRFKTRVIHYLFAPKIDEKK